MDGMIARIRFEPELAVIGQVPGRYTIEQIDGEVGIYSATPEFVRDQGGPITNSILDVIAESGFLDEAERLGLFPNLDVRVHRLYPGDIPAFPGWHADGEYRESYHAQPDLHRVRRHSHVVCHVSTEEQGVSTTEFLTEPFTADVEDPSVQNRLWGQVHRQVEATPDLVRVSSTDGEITRFGSLTLHRARPAEIRGWRLFVRASMWHKPPLDCAGGKISKQEQVYRVDEGSGW
jgi:hypothetical protein